MKNLFLILFDLYDFYFENHDFIMIILRLTTSYFFVLLKFEHINIWVNVILK